MKVYTYDPAPNPRRLKLFMDYKGIDIETEQVDLGPAQQQHSDEYKAINPMRTVPALITDDGDLLTEVIGQCVYLENLYPEKPLLGSTSLEKASVINWDHRLFMTGVAAIADIFRNGHPAFKGNGLPGPLMVEQIPELVERGKLRLEQFWSMMDEHLATTKWIAGDNFTFADIDMVCIIEFAGWIKDGIPDDCANLLAWHERALAELG
ncbi:MAG: glutathione S-transferase family protein [Halieaceae bacterium]